MQPRDFQPYYENSSALVIGINEYEYASPLSYARNDAERIATLLTSSLNFPKERVTLLKDKDATKDAIMGIYLDYVGNLQSPDDRLLFFFAGHGLTMPGYQGDVGYLVPANGDPKRLSTLVRWDDLTRNADLIIAKHILFILDACFSGLALKRVSYPGVKRFLSDMLQRRSRQVITAGKADEVVADGGGPEGQNSIFTGHLIEGLQGAAASESGILTANGLMHYVYDKLAHDPDSHQTPHYGHFDGDGDFVFIAPSEDLQKPLENDLIIEAQPEPSYEEQAVPLTYNNNVSFANSNGYSNPSHPTFGRNLYSDNLGTVTYEDAIHEEKAFSWLAVVIEPIGGSLEINLAQLAKSFANYKSKDNSPYESFYLPRQKKTSLNSIALFDQINYREPYWSRYVRIEKSGAIEYCDSYLSFRDFKGMRSFEYVQIVGATWQFIFFVKNVLGNLGYKSGVKLLLNLIGTKDTILANFSKAPGKDNKHWLSPGEDPFLTRGDPSSLECNDPNLQMQYELVLSNLDESSSHKLIVDIAEKLGLAYNHQSEPRCFNYETNEFPWQQFLNQQRY